MSATTRFATTGPEGPQLGPDDAENLRTQFNAIRDDIDTLLTGTGLRSTASLAEGTTAENVASGAFEYQIDGVTYAKDAVAAGTAFTATTHDIASDKEAIFVLSIDTGGTITITKGDDAAAGEGVAPATPTGECKMGEVKILATGDTFDATSDGLDETWLTVTYTDTAAIAQTSSDLTVS